MSTRTSLLSAEEKKKAQGQFTHIVLLVDASSSMSFNGLTGPVIQVVDSLIEKWTKQSLQLNDMTRLTVYLFSSQGYLDKRQGFECVWYDTDIQRLSTLEDRYEPDGGTALIDATLRAQRELSLVPTEYGDHTFLFFVLTDGEENRSSHSASELRHMIENLPNNWSMGALVPHVMGRADALKYGFPPGNIQVWDATSARGVEEAGEVIAQATATYMQARTNSGLRSSKSLFVGGQVDAAAIKAAKLSPLRTDEYAIVPVTPVSGLVQEKPDPTKKKPAAGQPDNRPMVAYMEIEPFISRVHPPFRVGKAYYELVKTERIAGNKQLAIVDKDGKVYLGEGVRQMLGLAAETKTVKPDFNPIYKIYVQSTSLNRHLYLHSSVLVLTK